MRVSLILSFFEFHFYSSIVGEFRLPTSFQMVLKRGGGGGSRDRMRRKREKKGREEAENFFSGSNYMIIATPPFPLLRKRPSGEECCSNCAEISGAKKCPTCSHFPLKNQKSFGQAFSRAHSCPNCSFDSPVKSFNALPIPPGNSPWQCCPVFRSNPDRIDPKTLWARSNFKATFLEISTLYCSDWQMTDQLPCYSYDWWWFSWVPLRSLLPVFFS